MHGAIGRETLKQRNRFYLWQDIHQYLWWKHPNPNFRNTRVSVEAIRGPMRTFHELCFLAQASFLWCIVSLSHFLTGVKLMLFLFTSTNIPCSHPFPSDHAILQMQATTTVGSPTLDRTSFSSYLYTFISGISSNCKANRVNNFARIWKRRILGQNKR